jgi:DNA-binding response OmpR family regulator/REP element-mobilizing transposase RayT
MVQKVLAVTATATFGELIRHTLTESGRYHVTLVDSGGEALGEIQEQQFPLAIIDSDLPDIPLGDLARALRKLCPDMRLIVIPPEGSAADSAVAEIAPDGLLCKPFYAPDLLDTVDELLAQASQPIVPPSQPEPAAPPPSTPTSDSRPEPATKKPKTTPIWLQDVTRAAQHLARLSLETAAQAALIVRQSELWAYAGQLSQPAAQELAQAVVSYWDRGAGSDVARFVHLGAVNEDFMLYATRLDGGLVLALAFDVETPFTRMRSQAVQLARSLATIPENPKDKTQTQPISDMSGAGNDAEQRLNEALKGLPPLLEDVPPPNPGRGRPTRLPPREPASKPAPALPVDEPPEAEATPPPADHRAIQESAPAQLLPPDPDEAAAEQSPHEPPVQERISEPLIKFDDRPRIAPLPKPEPIFIQPEAPQPAPAKAELEPGSPAMINLNYSCILIPRLPQHHLAGDLGANLSEWVPQICLAFGWRLEHLLVHETYLQWIVSVSPITSPSYLMRVLRQQTSQRIFNEYPSLARQNPSGDFWAPGYLIMSSSTPPPPQVVQDFIRQTRQYQGASKPLSRQ